MEGQSQSQSSSSEMRLRAFSAAAVAEQNVMAADIQYKTALVKNAFSISNPICLAALSRLQQAEREALKAGLYCVSLLSVTGTAPTLLEAKDIPLPVTPKTRGRPKGSKNKTPLLGRGDQQPDAPKKSVRVKMTPEEKKARKESKLAAMSPQELEQYQLVNRMKGQRLRDAKEAKKKAELEKAAVEDEFEILDTPRGEEDWLTSVPSIVLMEQRRKMALDGIAAITD